MGPSLPAEPGASAEPWDGERRAPHRGGAARHRPRNRLLPPSRDSSEILALRLTCGSQSAAGPSVLFPVFYALGRPLGGQSHSQPAEGRGALPSRTEGCSLCRSTCAGAVPGRAPFQERGTFITLSKVAALKGFSTTVLSPTDGKRREKRGSRAAAACLPPPKTQP